jgi:hypothetical protein
MLQHEAGEGSVSASSAPQVRRRAAERLIMTADQAAQMLVRMMEDTKAPFGVRAKIAQDLLDRAGLWLRRSTRSSRRRRTDHAVLRGVVQRPEQLAGEPATRPASASHRGASDPPPGPPTPSRRRSWKQRSSSQKASPPTTRHRGSQR